MARSDSQGFVAVFLVLISALGAIGGVITGSIFDGAIHDRRVLAIVAAFVAVAFATAVRILMARRAPALFLARQRTGLTRALVIIACITSLASGLAAHDLSRLAEITSGPIIGFVSGTLAALIMALLMIVYFHRHPAAGVEF